MRLICPNCDAQYEVDSNAIPEMGRDVQCSNCGHAWFQMRDVEPEDPGADLYREPDFAAMASVPDALVQNDPAPDEPESEEPEPEDDDGPQPVLPPSAVKRSLDDSVLAVLREEAEREAAARKVDAQGLEMQGDLGLPPPVSTAVGAAAVASGMTDAEKRIASMKGEPIPTPRPAARRDLLPDIEEINSTLRPSETVARDDGSMEIDTKQDSSGFKSGFALILMVALFAVVLYVMAPQISTQIPAAADTMAAYVAAVDAARSALDGVMQKATGALNSLTGG